jgi:hypothetical protein
VTDRIQALEEDKKTYAARIDAEIAELKGELGMRQRAIDAQREGLKSAMSAASAGAKSGSTGGAGATRPTGAVDPSATTRDPAKPAPTKTRVKPGQT